MNIPFDLPASPRLHFGTGKINVLPSILSTFGRRILMVRGAHSFDGAHGKTIVEMLQREGYELKFVSVPGEPTPDMIDAAVVGFSAFKPDVVVAVGGGSVLDAGKAISAMLPISGSVRDYLEGVGTRAHPGTKIPFIAMPTTAGTGSEATKNAVISEVGVDGFKRSLRHNAFVPDVAIIDPELTLSCPTAVTAASGIDAFTQLLESYVSTSASALTDAMAEEGMRHIGTSLMAAFVNPADLQARSNMAFAAFLSGVTLATAGLGLVHGFASSVGARYDIPHGMVCSALMLGANEVTIRKLRALRDNAALEKFRRAGQLVLGDKVKNSSIEPEGILRFIEQCITELNIPRLSYFGIRESDLAALAAKTDNKNNPVPLDTEEKVEVLRMSL